MRHSKVFNTFLHEVVNLNQTRIDTLEGHVRAVQRFLRNADFDARIKRFSPQGSWAQGTIIRPPKENDEFDADVLVVVEEVEDWEPEEYVNALYRAFSTTNRYAEKVHHKKRCIRLDYAGDFHLDVVPCIERELRGENSHWVLNRETNEEERSEPEEYTAWQKERNDWVGRNMLRKVIRLAKYLRDIKSNFSVKSIVLTTLLCERVTRVDEFCQSEFEDVATAMQILFGRMDDWLQARISMPSIPNPVLPSQDLDLHWTKKQFKHFRSMIHKYRGWIDDAYLEEDRDESLRKWRKVFGEEFGESALSGHVASLERSNQSTVYANLVPEVTSGRLSLADVPVWPHVERPQWRMLNKAGFWVDGWVYMSQDDSDSPLYRLDFTVLPKDRHLRFEARNDRAVPRSFQVIWQVVNSGREAYAEGDLRGGFDEAKSNSKKRWERTAYSGLHWLEAFLVNSRTNECVARSGRLFVMVE